MPIPRNLTIKTQQALEQAGQIAQENFQSELTPLHLLLALISQN